MSRWRERAKKAERVAYFERKAWERGGFWAGRAVARHVLSLTGKIIHGSHDMERVHDIGACKACCHAFVGEQVADELLAPCVPVSPYDRAWAKLLMDLKERVFKECQIQATGGSVEVSDYDHGADYGARIGVRANTDPSRYLEMSISKAQGERVLNLDAFGVRFLRRFMHEWRKMDEHATMPIRSHVDGSLDISIDLGLEKTPGDETDESFKRRVIEQIDDRYYAAMIRASAADADDLALADEVERGGHHKCEACGKIVDKVTRFIDRMLGPCCLHIGIDLASK